ncbi:MAG TPA: VCBS repeat-containing protein [Bryobacteraceae bacterium]|nr:VCBS repeat-containing protein [Bryobacteraceae bacterium]
MATTLFWVTSISKTRLSALFGNGDGTSQPTLQVHSEVGWLYAVAVGDLNADGLPISRPLRAAAGALNLPAAASYMITGAAMAVSVLLNEGNRTH